MPVDSIAPNHVDAIITKFGTLLYIALFFMYYMFGVDHLLKFISIVWSQIHHYKVISSHIQHWNNISWKFSNGQLFQNSMQYQIEI